jgi:hypothetical protein
MLQASSACESLRLMRCHPQQLQEISERASEWKPYTPRLESHIIDGLSSGPAFRRAPPLHRAHPESKSMRRYYRPGQLWNSACKTLLLTIYLTYNMKVSYVILFTSLRHVIYLHPPFPSNTLSLCNPIIKQSP